MFSAYPPISIMRIFSLNKVRKSWELLHVNESRHGVRHGQAGIFKRKNLKMSCVVVTASSPKSVLSGFQRGATGLRRASPDPSYAQRDVRMERVAAIRAAIAQGSYHVSAADLAQKLMDHMLAHRPAKN
jgi:Anti-sigma-28 factor, FlgM